MVSAERPSQDWLLFFFNAHPAIDTCSLAIGLSRLFAPALGGVLLLTLGVILVRLRSHLCIPVTVMTVHRLLLSYYRHAPTFLKSRVNPHHSLSFYPIACERRFLAEENCHNNGSNNQ